MKNEDARPEAYSEMKTKFRPSHADFTYFAKYGIRAWQGGGRASARETVGRVAAGAIAKKILREKFGVETLAYVKQVQKIIGGNKSRQGEIFRSRIQHRPLSRHKWRRRK